MLVCTKNNSNIEVRLDFEGKRRENVRLNWRNNDIDNDRVIDMYLDQNMESVKDMGLHDSKLL